MLITEENTQASVEGESNRQLERVAALPGLLKVAGEPPFSDPILVWKRSILKCRVDKTNATYLMRITLFPTMGHP